MASIETASSAPRGNSSKPTAETVRDETVMIARQPIFDRNAAVFGYELLFRSSSENFYQCTDPRFASAQTLCRALHSIGLQAVTGTRRAFINFPTELLLEEMYTILPKDRCVIEILETTIADDNAVAACKKLREAGYQLALDDVVEPAAEGRLLELADYIKVDFRALAPERRKSVIARLKPLGSKLVAEKVESKEEFVEAIDCCCELAQGYFFCKPELMISRGLSGAQVVCMELMQELNRPILRFDVLSQIIKRDASLTIKLLRYINSAGMGIRNTITSIERALVMLGDKTFRRWATLVALTNVSRKRPPELLVTSLVRAHFCEQVAIAQGLKEHELDMFMIGLLSALDAILDLPMDTALAQTAASPAARAVLLEQPEAPRELKRIFSLAVACERGDWGAVAEAASGLKITQSEIAVLFYDALTWSDQMFAIAA